MEGNHKEFSPGDHIEFLSNQHGGVWKPGVVDSVIGYRSPNIRIHVGNDVYIIRPKQKCRLAKNTNTGE